MNKIIGLFLVLLTLVGLLFSGCSAIFRTVEAGNPVEKTYDFKDFTNIEISDSIKYEIKQAASYSVVVSTHENIVEHMDIHQSANTLHIGLNFGFSSGGDILATITLPQLTKLAVSGSCMGEATGFNSSNDLETTVSGASKLRMQVQAGKTTVDVSGAGEVSGDLTSSDTTIKLSGSSNLNMNLQTGKTGMDISGNSKVNGNLLAQDTRFTLGGSSNCALTGSAGNSVIEASGASGMTSPNLTLQSADVHLTGSSYASIHTDGTLNIDLSGVSTLDYTGNPSIGKINIGGSSKVNHN